MIRIAIGETVRDKKGVSMLAESRAGQIVPLTPVAEHLPSHVVRRSHHLKSLELRREASDFALDKCRRMNVKVLLLVRRCDSDFASGGRTRLRIEARTFLLHHRRPISRTGDALFRSASLTANLSVIIGQQVSRPTAARRLKCATVRK